MITIEKLGNIESPDIKITNGLKSFIIARNNLPDLCWYPNIDYFQNTEDFTFVIKEDDGYIYILFNELYQNIIEGNLFPLTKEHLNNKTPEEVSHLKSETEKEKTRFREEAKRSGLVNEGIINYYSEDYDEYEYASVLTIKKHENQIEINFKKNRKNDEQSFIWIPTYNVRITESGGRYDFFHIPFVTLRRQLQSLELKEDNQTNNKTLNLKKS